MKRILTEKLGCLKLMDRFPARGLLTSQFKGIEKLLNSACRILLRIYILANMSRLSSLEE